LMPRRIISWNLRTDDPAEAHSARDV
jgi:hypothetical protein